MTINNKYYTEPEAAAYIMQLEAAVRRYEDENRKLTEEKEELGGLYNDASLGIGYLEQRCEELEKRNAELIDLTCGWKDVYNDMILGFKKGLCAICKRNESTGLIGRCKSCFDGSEWVWRYADKYLREPDEKPEKCECYESGHWYLGDEAGTCNGTKEREACNCKGDKEKCDYYKNSNR